MYPAHYQWVYASDTEAVQSAQEAYDNAQYEELVNVLNELIEALEKIKIEDLNLYDDHGNQINTLEDLQKIAKPYLAAIDTIFKDNGAGKNTPDIGKILASLGQYIPPAHNIPNYVVPDFTHTPNYNSMNVSKVELVLPNVTDNSTANDIAKAVVNTLSNLGTYGAQYDWNK